VAYPQSEADVEALLGWCGRQQIAAVPYGGGTSVVGGVEVSRGKEHRGVVTIDLRRMGRVLEIDATSRAARVEAGVLGPALEQQLAPHGFSLRHYPQSFEFSTLGGWIATRAGGHFATLYTHIDDLVESVRMVTPRGVLQTPRLPASGAGPSPDRLILGSEGALGIITEAWVRVQQRPRWRESASVSFPSFAQAVAAARGVAQSGLFPANCRVLDPTEALISGVSGDGSAVLLLGFESADHPLTPWMDRALAIATTHGGSCPRGAVRRDDGVGGASRGGDAGAETWRSAFFEGPYRQSALVSLGIIADTFETACTWSGFEALDAALRDALAEAFARIGAKGAVACRFTHVYPDGPAPYYTFLASPRPGGELEGWEEIKRAASDTLVRLGATITHHHAVGRLHRPWYDQERPELFADALRATKRALDPSWILNPGVLIDP
jgi:alkyldihydroxyacetonephosphate synthase